MSVRFFVGGKIVLEHALSFETVGKLEAENRVMDSPRDHLLDILLGSLQLAFGLGIIRHSAAEDDAFELQPLGQLASGLV